MNGQQEINQKPGPMPDELKACCGTCNAWRRTNGDIGECQAQPPVPMLVGVQQIPMPTKNIMMPGQQQTFAQPIIHSFFPGMKEPGWCRAWQPNADHQAATLRLQMKDMAAKQNNGVLGAGGSSK